MPLPAIMNGGGGLPPCLLQLAGQTEPGIAWAAQPWGIRPSGTVTCRSVPGAVP
eukprot:CAMPEP_0118925592 /NCGR_PEP_ID=MMETSP1169-20130426/3464_1 /TAXON_ID=36882 /ORGANISM="Pyramimonas obovata, Strain CCMP722" /LENGTH=53 /DNA_ID=CAMNT_0006866939 /DNA_START=225 /DNA_END=382 /DNA_ORIENTATION=+